MNSHEEPASGDSTDLPPTTFKPTDLVAKHRALLSIANSLALWHARGRLYGSISLLQLKESGWKLPPPPERIGIAEFCGEAHWYMPSSASLSLQIPSTLLEAGPILAEAGLTASPEVVDCFVLGQLACQLFGDCNAGEYLRSPRSVARIPAGMRSFIDAALGFNKSQRVEELDELVRRLELVNFKTIDPSGDLTQADRPSKEESGTEEQSDLDVPFKTLGHFRILRMIGHGGMGDVYEGLDESLKRRVAIKILPAALGREPSFVQRFYSEASSAAKIIHPNIVQIYFIGQDHGHHFFAMEFVNGDSLAGLLATRLQLEILDAVSIVEQVLRGLSAAHAHALVHRDVKPGNILLENKTNRCLLVDFGLVKSLYEVNGPTHSGMVLGTMDYISPEQGRGKPVDGRSDIYALGVVFYELICGKLPFVADSPTSMIFQHVYERPAPLHKVAPRTPMAISAIVARMMAKDPLRRYPDAHAVLADLQAFRDGVALPSNSVQQLAEDPLSFSRPVQSAREEVARSVIVRAPNFDLYDDDLEVLNQVSPPLFGRLISRVHDWIEQRSPAFAQRMQNTQMQVDRAVLKLERHRDHLAVLDSDARLILKKLKQQLATCDPDKGAEGSKSLVNELQFAVSEQQEQSDQIHAQLNRIKAQLAQVRTERDVLVARLQAADAKRRMHVDDRRTFPLFRLMLGLFLSLCALGLFWRNYRFFAYVMPNVSSVSTEKNSIVKPTYFTGQWPATGENEFAIPLPANVRSMAVITEDMLGQPYHSVYASLDNDMVAALTYRRDQNHVYGNSFVTGPVGVHAVAISPSRTYVAFATEDGSIPIFQTSLAGKEVYRRLEGHQKPATSINFSADETELISVSSDQTIRGWEIQSGSEKRREKLPDAYTPLMASNRSNNPILLGPRRLIAGYQDAFQLRVWDAINNRLINSIPVGGVTSAMAIDNKGDTAYCFASSVISVWNTKTGLKIREFAFGSEAAAFAVDANRALTLSGQQAHLWNTQTGELIESKDFTLASDVTHLTLSQNGETAFAATRNKQLRIVNLTKVPPPKGWVHSFYESTPIYSLDVANDSTWAAGGSKDSIFLWNLNLPASSYKLDTLSQVSVVQFSPYGDYLAYGTGQKGSKLNYVGVRELQQNSLERLKHRGEDWRKLTNFEGPLSALAWDAYGKRVLASSEDGAIKIWAPKADMVETSTQLLLPIVGLENLTKSSMALLLTASGAIRSWKWNSTSPSSEFFYSKNDVLQIAMSVPQNDLLAIASREGKIIVYEIESQKLLVSLEFGNDSVTKLRFVPTSRRLVSGHSSGLIRVWDIRESREIAKFEKGQAPISALAITPNGRFLLSVALGKTVDVWELP